MKLKFLSICIDKNNGRQYRPDEVVEFDEKRGTEILGSSFAVRVDTPEEPKPTTKKSKKKDE